MARRLLNCDGRAIMLLFKIVVLEVSLQVDYIFVLLSRFLTAVIAACKRFTHVSPKGLLILLILVNYNFNEVFQMLSEKKDCKMDES